MTRNLFLFLGTFVLGAVIALVVRAARFEATPDHEGHPPAGGDYAPMVSNTLAPTAPTAAAPTASPAADPHAGHDMSAAAAPAAQPEADADKPVNTVCAICGMDVDPSLPTEKYQGKTIGFGCKMCPPKFRADPDRYGPYYLRNEVIKR